MKIAITGSTGFIGSALLKKLVENKHDITAILRKPTPESNEQKTIIVPEISSTTKWTEKLMTYDIIIHCAARVHVMKDNSTNPLAEFRNINTFGTLNLAQSAADSGVKRFIFISTIKVSGEYTIPGKSFKSSQTPNPIDNYAISKFEAEQGLLEIGKKTGMEVVIIRPPLVYGPGVKANFQKLMEYVKKTIPLPLGAVNNSRSLVSMDNLIDLIATCVVHPKAANQIFLVSDDHDVSTTQLLKKLANALNKPSLLIPVPRPVFTFFSKLFGKQAIVNRLFESLQVDIEHTKNTLNWQPPISFDKALKKTATFYKNSNH